MPFELGGDRSGIDTFETLLGHDAGNHELAVVIAALASAHAEAPTDAALTRELHSLNLD